MSVLDKINKSGLSKQEKVDLKVLTFNNEKLANRITEDSELDDNDLKGYLKALNAQADPIDVFIKLLSESGVSVNPRVVGILRHDKEFRTKAKLCASPHEASCLYATVASALSTNAKNEMIQNEFKSDQVIVGIDRRIEVSPLSSSTFIYRTFLKLLGTGAVSQCYLKIKISSDSKKESDVWEALKSRLTSEVAESLFGKCELMNFHKRLTHHPNITCGLIMPIYTGTLMDIPVSVSVHMVQDTYSTVSKALKELHSMGLVHSDVKPQNIFLAHGGGVRLGDYDACTNVGQPVQLSTRVFWSADLKADESMVGSITATARIDFIMLAATLFFMLDKWSIIDGAQPSVQTMIEAAKKDNLVPILECLSHV